MALPKLKAPHISKKVLYITAGLLLILALLAVGAVSQVRQERIQKAQDTAKDQSTAKTINDLKDKLAVSEAATATSEKKRVGVCTYVSSLTKQRIVQQYVAVPLVYCQ